MYGYLQGPNKVAAVGREVVSLAAVFIFVTQRSSPRCVTRLKTASRETSREVAVIENWPLVGV